MRLVRVDLISMRLVGVDFISVRLVLVDLISVRLVGVVEARKYMMSSFSQWVLSMAWI